MVSVIESPLKRLVRTAGCYVLLLSVFNPAGWLTIVLAFVLLPRFPVALSICHLLLALSVVAGIDYAWLRTLACSDGLRLLAYALLGIGAAALYVYLANVNSAYVATLALVVGLLVLLGIWHLKLWLRPEIFRSVWG